jgi:hypothetical protein
VREVVWGEDGGAPEETFACAEVVGGWVWGVCQVGAEKLKVLLVWRRMKLARWGK